MEPTTKKFTAAPIYAAAAAWLLYALLFPLYRPAHFCGAAAATVIIFLAASVLCRSGLKKAAANEAHAAGEQKKAAAEAKSTADPALEQMLRDGTLAIREMQRLDKNIRDEKISADIVHLEQTSEKIFAYVKEHPDQLGEIRRFMNYYLPTTLKLLNAYDRMSAQGVSGENLDASMKRIEQMLDTIPAAFDKQLDALFGKEALDISTDITVLENMMAQEGLTGDPLKSGTSAPSDNSGIRLEL